MSDTESNANVVYTDIESSADEAVCTDMYTESSADEAEIDSETEVLDDFNQSGVLDDFNHSEVLDDSNGSEVLDDPNGSEVLDDSDHSEVLDIFGHTEPSPPFEVLPTDIVIAVMGVTGSGKSTFISLFADEGYEPVIGDTIESQTREITFIPATLPNGTHLFLVDTPGFNDTYLSDTEVLEMISENLAAAYKGNIKLRGVIYLHPISDVRMTGASMKNLFMFKALCGADQLSSVVLATTHWANTEPEIAKQIEREKQLRNAPKMWGNMIAKGSTIFRQNRGIDSAAEIVQHLVNKQHPVTLEIQSDIVDKGLQLKDTAAGKEIINDLEKKQKEHEAELTKIRQEMEAALAKKDQEAQEELKAWRAEVREKMEQADADRRRLDADKEALWRRLEQARAEAAEAHRQAMMRRPQLMMVSQPRTPIAISMAMRSTLTQAARVPKAKAAPKKNPPAGPAKPKAKPPAPKTKPPAPKAKPPAPKAKPPAAKPPVAKPPAKPPAPKAKQPPPQPKKCPPVPPPAQKKKNANKPGQPGPAAKPKPKPKPK